MTSAASSSRARAAASPPWPTISARRNVAARGRGAAVENRPHGLGAPGGRGGRRERGDRAGPRRRRAAASLEHVEELRRALRAEVPVLLRRPRDEAQEGGVPHELRDLARGRRDGVVGVRTEQRPRVGGRERVASGEDSVGDDARAVQVGAVVHLAADGLLGREELRRAHDEAGLRLLRSRPARRDLRDPEVEDLEALAAAGQRDEPEVLGLEVAVDDACSVRLGEPGEELLQEAGHLLWREPPHAAQAVRGATRPRGAP